MKYSSEIICGQNKSFENMNMHIELVAKICKHFPKKIFYAYIYCVCYVKRFENSLT